MMFTILLILVFVLLLATGVLGYLFADASSTRRKVSTELGMEADRRREAERLVYCHERSLTMLLGRVVE